MVKIHPKSESPGSPHALLLIEFRFARLAESRLPCSFPIPDFYFVFQWIDWVIWISNPSFKNSSATANRRGRRTKKEGKNTFFLQVCLCLYSFSLLFLLPSFNSVLLGFFFRFGLCCRSQIYGFWGAFSISTDWVELMADTFRAENLCSAFILQIDFFLLQVGFWMNYASPFGWI